MFKITDKVINFITKAMESGISSRSTNLNWGKNSTGGPPGRFTYDTAIYRGLRICSYTYIYQIYTIVKE